jgi:DNA-binding HxlR family transcriptional regulator
MPDMTGEKPKMGRPNILGESELLSTHVPKALGDRLRELKDSDLLARRVAPKKPSKADAVRYALESGLDYLDDLRSKWRDGD